MQSNEEQWKVSFIKIKLVTKYPKVKKQSGDKTDEYKLQRKSTNKLSRQKEQEKGIKEP